MKNILYQKLTDPDICRENLRGVYHGDGWHFATNGFVGVFESGESDLPSVKNPDTLGPMVEKLAATEGAMVEMLFNPEYLRMALEMFDGEHPIKVSVFAFGNGYKLRIEDEGGAALVTSMVANGAEFLEWKGMTK